MSDTQPETTPPAPAPTPTPAAPPPPAPAPTPAPAAGPPESIPYARFSEEVARRKATETRVTELSERLAAVEAAAESARIEAAAARAGVTDPEAVEIARERYGRAPAEGRPDFGAWLSAQREAGAKWLSGYVAPVVPPGAPPAAPPGPSLPPARPGGVSAPAPQTGQLSLGQLAQLAMTDPAAYRAAKAAQRGRS